MNPLLYIVALLALGSFAAMCISVIMFLGRAKTFLDTTAMTLQSTQRVLEDVNKQIGPTLDLVHSTLRKTTETLERIDTQLDTMHNSLHNVDSMVQRVTTLQQRVQSKVEEPIMKTASFIAAISKAVQAVNNALRK